jgi:hypothetical protein
MPRSPKWSIYSGFSTEILRILLIFAIHATFSTHLIPNNINHAASPPYYFLLDPKIRVLLASRSVIKHLQLFSDVALLLYTSLFNRNITVNYVLQCCWDYLTVAYIAGCNFMAIKIRHSLAMKINQVSHPFKTSLPHAIVYPLTLLNFQRADH